MESSRRWRFRFRQFVILIVAWFGVSLIFGLVQSAAEFHSNKPTLFLLFANGVHFGLWALMTPLLAALVRRFPLQRGEALAHVVVLPTCCVLAAAVSLMDATVYYLILAA